MKTKGNSIYKKRLCMKIWDISEFSFGGTARSLKRSNEVDLDGDFHQFFNRVCHL